MTRAVAGMRGGLGRILLTAFMLLAIVPLSVVSYLAVRRVQKDLRQATMDDLDLIAASKAEQLQSWLNAQQYSLTLLANDRTFRKVVRLEQWEDACRVLDELRLGSPDPMTVSLQSADGRATLCSMGDTALIDVSRALSLTVSVMDDDEHPATVLVGYPDPRVLSRVVDTVGTQDDQRVFLIDESAGRSLLLSSERERWADVSLYNWAIDEQGGRFYDDASGHPVVGAYRRLPDREAALLVEQSAETALAREDDLAAMLIGSTLAVALLTTVLAAVVSRQLTRPIVRLTMSAVKIARGDLRQRVEVNRRDEIGILAQAFNIMTAELRSVYDGLEQKVSERTSQLTEANRRLRYQAMQLELSAEVGRVATSILDLDLLLKRVTELILDSYAHVYYVNYVAVLLQDEFGERVALQACSGRDNECSVSLVEVGDDTPVGHSAADGLLRVYAFGQNEIGVAVPLRIGAQVIGVLHLSCTHKDALSPNDADVLQSLGDQISVAIANARLYAIEREAVERLSRLDDLRLASLGVGSRELATELNTIIGFSRLILKGVDGPLTDLQRADLGAIYKSGYKLLGLIDHVITLSELDSEAVEPDLRPIDLALLLEEVLATARQRLVDVSLAWRKDGALPLLRGDASLLREAFLGLLTDVAEQVPDSSVVVRIFASEDHPGHLCVGIGDGDGLLQETETGDVLASELSEDVEMSVGLALAKRIVALHDGELRLQFDIEHGLNSVVLLPTNASNQM